ncbi:MAG: NADH-quinone oxidoreductase subunit I [Pseudoflavonifractor sp.]|nr:NADH-quinone oxidoreductase subunit I [Pseudoflavonifractor sp.]
MGSVKDYFSSLGSGVLSLLKGMQVTGKELVTPKVTELYPENRDTQKIPDRFRAELTLKYDAEGRHKCIACGICQRNCPNGTITITTKTVDTPDGKKKRKLDRYIYDLGSCIFCQLCVSTCPQDALEFSNDFEQAVFNRDKLVKQLNYLPEKEDPAPTPEELAKAAAEREAKIAAAKAAAAAKKAAAAAAQGSADGSAAASKPEAAPETPKPAASAAPKAPESPENNNK